MMNISEKGIMSITEEALEQSFYVHMFKSTGPIFQSAILYSKARRFVIDTRTNECLDKRTGKCYILGKATKDIVFLSCWNTFNVCYQ